MSCDIGPKFDLFHTLLRHVTSDSTTCAKHWHLNSAAHAILSPLLVKWDLFDDHSMVAAMDSAHTTSSKTKAAATLTEVPVEIRREIVHWVSKQPNPFHRQRDLASLCLTNKWLYDDAAPCLYSSMKYYIPSATSDIDPAFSVHNRALRCIRELELSINDVEEATVDVDDERFPFEPTEVVLNALTPNSILKFE